MLQALELSFGKQQWSWQSFLAPSSLRFLSSVAALLSSMKRVNADNTGKVSGLHGRELTRPG